MSIVVVGLASLALTGAGTPLQVLDAYPRATAAPFAEIGVMFDRPVTADPGRVLSITPTIAGHAEWRTPVTLLFHPDEPLRADTRYVVVVSTDVRATDGSQLTSPYTFMFKTGGAHLAWLRPLGPA